MNSETFRPPPNTLQFYWYETPPSDQLGVARGQLSAAIGRLVDIEEQLTSVSRHRDMAGRLRRATIIVEAYLSRAYELRERAVDILAIVTGQPATAKRCKDPSKRAEGMESIRQTCPELADNIAKLLSVLDEDTALRNMQTHEQLLSVGLWLEDGPYDVEDLLIDCAAWTSTEQTKLIAVLRTAIRNLVGEYKRRARSVINAANLVAEAAHSHHSERA